jgi:hypothetical protein
LKQQKDKPVPDVIQEYNTYTATHFKPKERPHSPPQSDDQKSEEPNSNYFPAN